MESNHRPLLYKSSALTPELLARDRSNGIIQSQ